MIPPIVAATPVETRSTCPYCGVGCGVIIQSQGNQITGVRGDPEHPANFGRLCSKGATLHLTASAAVTQQTRLLTPQMRSKRSDMFTATTWDMALTTATQTFARIVQEHGPDAVGFYVSGQLLTEDYYVFNKLAKGLIGTNNIDTNSRLCMSSAVAGYKKTLGADAPPTCYDDVNHAQTIFIVGSNTAYAHPILFRRIEDAKRNNPALKIIFCDPRKTDTAEIADLYLPLQPGTDVMLFNGMLHIMLWEGWVDNAYIAAHTIGFNALKDLVRDYTPDVVAQTCGIRKEDLLQATRWFAGVPDAGSGELAQVARKPTLSLYCQGLNQSSSGTAKNTALINLHLATGQIGKPGAGPFSLTGQPNAMGGREVGGLANLLSAHRNMASAEDRAEVAALWGVADVPAKPGKTAVEMFQAAADGEIRALWIACTNPAQSMPDQATVRRALERAEFVVVQEAFATTATCAFADLLLPATTWGEKEGTVTNSERRISRVRAAVPPPFAPDESLVGTALCCVSPARFAGSSFTSAEHHANQTLGHSGGGPRHDWVIAVDFARRLEVALGRTGSTLFPYDSAESLWNEHRESTRGRDLDITGLSYAMLDAAPQQWPFVEHAGSGKARLYEDGVFPTADGRASFCATPYRPVAEARESRFPFSLTTGRLRDHWHGMSRTGTLGRLFGHVPEPVLQMHPQDMVRRQLGEGDLVHVTSKRGSIMVPVQGSTELGLSQVFMAMHWGEEFISGVAANGQRLAGVNALTTSAYCPDSKQPEFKHAAVKVLRAEMPWTLLAMAWLPEAAVLQARRELQALMGEFAFCSCVPFSNAVPMDDAAQARHGLMLRAAHHEPVSDTVLRRVEEILQLHGADVARYVDAKNGQRRSVRLQSRAADAPLLAFLLAGDTRSKDWISALLQDGQAAMPFGRALLIPGPLQRETAPRANTVCTCFNVSDIAIQNHLDGVEGNRDERVASLQAALKCGTNCGSCVPQLRRMARAPQAVPL